MPHALLLNASYEPLCVVSQRRAVVLILSDKAVTLEGSGDLLHAATWSMPAPSVIRLTRYIRVPNRRAVPLTRRAIFARDGGRCVYCDAPATSIDHVIPRSRGGRTLWTNVVTACGSCNLIKGNRLPKQSGMYPRHQPVQPTTYMLQENGRAFPPNYLHESWRDYLYWDSELES